MVRRLEPLSQEEWQKALGYFLYREGSRYGCFLRATGLQLGQE
jgi:hypothetical protein